MTFPFAFDFKFIQFKSWREDDMTSSNKRIWKVDLKISENILFGIYFIYDSIFKLWNNSKFIASKFQIWEEEHDPPYQGHFCEIFEP